MQVIQVPQKRYQRFMEALLRRRKEKDEDEVYLIYGFPWMWRVNCSNKAAVKNSFRGDTQRFKALLEELEIKENDIIYRRTRNRVWIFILIEVGRQVPSELWLLEQI